MPVPNDVVIRVEPHPLLEAAAFTTAFPRPLGSMPSPDWLVGLLSLEASAPVSRSEEARSAIRDLLRHGGYKPTGRGKPSSEYLARAVGDGALTSINCAVDACNVVSLHSGLPISVVDLDLAAPPLLAALGAAGTRYVFNASGQEIDVEGLLCLHDAGGPCANAVKDAQRTKTHDGTTRTLSIVWGSSALGDLTKRTTAWYREVLGRVGALTALAELRAPE